ncbi:LpqN/LpqT family lipoprotein [Mycolicibacterium mageritense]|uniref:LpqN/LpqT family lipoprotein n=1 Tax=Mycolicibacterium mageritense TaxID=53462 RepID=UPI001E37F616|nr:LpqN/LpqT family lipoprotein [Mycolicibacterium mageritense]MCC9182012.1 LpqN/LpqT family lipoprotein [Mycolicibacterium mageritense]
MPLASGQVFAGFTIVRLVGTGGMGEVYLAAHPRLPREDALKVLPQTVSADNEFRQRFIREADMAATLWHPHIVGVHDRGEFEGRLWIAMDYVDGTDAARLLHDQYPSGMPAEDVIEIIAAVADALDYAHARHLLHRDVKPANILLTSKQGSKRRIMLTDFGIARRADEVNGLTSTNITVGSMSYTAPEQLMGQKLDGRADQYSLAATAYRLFTGSPPYAHSNPAVVISHHLSSPVPKLAATKPELAAFDSVMARGLAKDPKDRYDTCHDFATALAEAAAGATAPTTRMPALAPTPTPAPQQAMPVAPPPRPPVPMSPSNPTAHPRPNPPSEPPVFTSSWTVSEPARKPSSGTGGIPTAGGSGSGMAPPPPTGFGPPPLPYVTTPRKKAGKRKGILIASAICAVVLLVGGITVAMTSGDDGPTPGPETSTNTAAPSSSETTASTPPQPPGHSYTIADYIRDNKINETTVHRGDPGAPVFTMPTPPGWADAGPRTPQWAYSAIVNDTITPTDPPSVISLISKLVGNVDTKKLLEFAPNELQNLADYEPVGGIDRGNLSGFNSVTLGGSYLKDGRRRAIMQTTVVMDSPGGMFVLQVNSDSLYRDMQALVDINKAISEQGTITVP